jgi:pyruvate/2-oxoglutarate/acetoin dehydrogenase E1 component
MTLKATYDLFIEQEIACKVIVFSKLNQINEEFFKSQIANSGPVLTVEESSKFFGFGSEIGSILNEDNKFKERKFRRIASKNKVIPASINLENEVLTSSKQIKNNINDILNA